MSQICLILREKLYYWRHFGTCVVQVEESIRANFRRFLCLKKKESEEGVQQRHGGGGGGRKAIKVANIRSSNFDEDRHKKVPGGRGDCEIHKKNSSKTRTESVFKDPWQRELLKTSSCTHHPPKK